MKITATPIKAGDLEPGDLFIAAWSEDTNLDLYVGLKVFIRGQSPTPKDEKDLLMYKLTIEKENTANGNDT